MLYVYRDWPRTTSSPLLQLFRLPCTGSIVRIIFRIKFSSDMDSSYLLVLILSVELSLMFRVDALYGKSRRGSEILRLFCAVAHIS